MNRPSKLPRTTIITLPFSALTQAQQAYHAKTMGKTVDQIAANVQVKIPGNMLSLQQSLQVQGIKTAPAQSGKIHRRQRTRKGGGATTQAFTQPTTQAGSGTQAPEMKINEYNQRGLRLKLVYGNGQQVARHLSTLPNRSAIALIAVDDVRTYAQGKFPWAAALYVDGFVQNFENMKQALPRSFAEGIVENLNAKSMVKKVSYLNFIAQFGNGVRYANASKSLKGTPAVKNFLNAIWASVFAKDGMVIGTTDGENTNTVFLLGDNAERTGYAWIGENFSLVPSSFAGKTTHHTLSRDFMIEFVPGTSDIKGVTAMQMWDAIQNCGTPEFQAVKIAEKFEGKIHDLSVVTATEGYGFVAVASLEDGKDGYLPLTIDLSGENISLKAIAGLSVPTAVAQKMGGWLGRVSRQGVTLISTKGENTVQRMPVSYLPTEMKNMVTGLYQPQSIAA